MKAEHRKELETNVLAQKLGEVYEGLRQGPSRSTVIWLIVLGAVVLGVGLFWYFLSSSRAADSQSWLKLDEAVFPAQLDARLKESELTGTPQFRIARFKEARVNLSAGLRAQGSNPKAALKRIESARDTYEELAKQSGRVPLLHQEALMGMAKANEALGNYEEARSGYERLTREYPSSALGVSATKQLERLGSEANKETLNKFKKLNDGGWLPRVSP